MTKTERFLSYKNQSKDLVKIAFNEALTEVLYNKSANDLRSITEKLITLLELEKNNGKTEPKSHSSDREDQPITTGILNSNTKTKRKNNPNNSK